MSLRAGMFHNAAQGGRTDKTRWILLGFLWIAFLIDNIDRQVVFSISPLLSRQLHFSQFQLGLVGSVFLWVYCASNPLLGRLADVIQREHLIIASMLLWSVATLGTALSYSVASFLAWRSALALAESMYVPAALGLIAVWHPGTSRSSALALHSTAQFTGIALGGWFGGLAAETIGWRHGFTLLAVGGILYAVSLAALAPRKSSPPAARGKVKASPFDIFRSRCFVALLVSYTVFTGMLFIFYNWLPEFVLAKYHLSLADSGLLATLYLQAGSVVGVLIWGVLSDFAFTRVHAGRYYLIALDLIGCVPFGIFIVRVNTVTELKLAAIAFGFFAGGLSANVVAAAFDVIATKNYGFGTGLINLAAGIGGGTGVLLVGWTRNVYGAVGVVDCLAIAVVAGAVGLAAAAGRRYTSERESVLATSEQRSA